MRLLEVLQAIAVIDRFGIQRADLRGIVKRLRCCSSTASLEDRNLVGVRIALEHRQLAGTQLVLVLRDIGRGDGELRLVPGEWVAEKAIGSHRCCARLQAAAPGRNAAVGIAGLFGAQRGQAGSKFGSFVRRHCGHHAAGEK
ncbi:hypothetical protein D3C78_933430 [compost metagenome]